MDLSGHSTTIILRQYVRSRRKNCDELRRTQFGRERIQITRTLLWRTRISLAVTTLPINEIAIEANPNSREICGNGKLSSCSLSVPSKSITLVKTTPQRSATTSENSRYRISSQLLMTRVSLSLKNSTDALAINDTAIQARNSLSAVPSGKKYQIGFVDGHEIGAMLGATRSSLAC